MPACIKQALERPLNVCDAFVCVPFSLCVHVYAYRVLLQFYSYCMHVHRHQVGCQRGERVKVQYAWIRFPHTRSEVVRANHPLPNILISAPARIHVHLHVYLCMLASTCLYTSCSCMYMYNPNTVGLEKVWTTSLNFWCLNPAVVN